jgi:hypothetical protein
MAGEWSLASELSFISVAPSIVFIVRLDFLASQNGQTLSEI